MYLEIHRDAGMSRFFVVDMTNDTEVYSGTIEECENFVAQATGRCEVEKRSVPDTLGRIVERWIAPSVKALAMEFAKLTRQYPPMPYCTTIYGTALNTRTGMIEAYVSRTCGD